MSDNVAQLREVYLDNAATTKIDRRVLDVMMPYLTDEYGNAGTLYGLGRRAKNAIDDARVKVAEFMHCDPDQIIFTSGGTEGNNLVIHGVAERMKQCGQYKIISSQTEHDSVIRAIESICARNNFDADFLPVSMRGPVITQELNITDKTGLVSVMYVNNETGAVNQVGTIGRICKAHSVLFHTDCVQAAGVYPVYMDEIPCDFATISSHKINGPKGVGAVFARDKGVLSPMICGGADQEFGLRGGTENVAGIVGFGEACRISGSELEQNRKTVSEYCALFRNTLVNGLITKTKDLSLDISLNGPCFGKVLNITVNGVDGETLVLMMNGMGVCISAGSACRSHEERPSRVLTAMGLSEEEARSSVRISFAPNMSKDDIVYAAEKMALCIHSLRGAV